MSLSSLKLSLILIPLAIGASYLHAQTTPPPGDNLAPPVHTLSGSQIKTSGLSLNGFVAQQRATFKQDTFISGIIKGALPGAASSTVSFGRTTDPVFAQVTGAVENTLTLGSDKLKNTASRTVCGTTGGEVVLCETPPVVQDAFAEKVSFFLKRRDQLSYTVTLRDITTKNETIVVRYEFYYLSNPSVFVKNSCTMTMSSGQIEKQMYCSPGTTPISGSYPAIEIRNESVCYDTTVSSPVRSTTMTTPAC